MACLLGSPRRKKAGVAGWCGPPRSFKWEDRMGTLGPPLLSFLFFLWHYLACVLLGTQAPWGVCVCACTCSVGCIANSECGSDRESAPVLLHGVLEAHQSPPTHDAPQPSHRTLPTPPTTQTENSPVSVPSPPNHASLRYVCLPFHSLPPTPATTTPIHPHRNQTSISHPPTPTPTPTPTTPHSFLPPGQCRHGPFPRRGWLRYVPTVVRWMASLIGGAF